MTAKTSAAAEATPVVGVIMGSSSDWEVMKHAVTMPVSYTHLTLPTTPYV